MKRTQMRSLLENERGAATYVQFLVVMMPLLVFILGIVQLAQLYIGRLTVVRAAEAAGRAAIVTLDDDPAFYLAAPRDSLQSWQSRTTDPVNAFLSFLGAPAGGQLTVDISPRMQDIRAAAVIPLLALTPPLRPGVGANSVHDNIGASRGTFLATDGVVYAAKGLAVALPSAPGAKIDKVRFDKTDLVTTRVTYQFHCGVPLVRYFMCQSNPTLGMPGARFFSMMAEITLPNHGANYRYSK
jgi:hypothetical protein